MWCIIMYTKTTEPFANKVWLSSPTMHGEEMQYMQSAYDSNWVSTVGENIREVERMAASTSQVSHAVALSSCTAALHLCVRLAGEALYGKPPVGHGALEGKPVFCSDMTFAATLNPVTYEGGVPIFIDTERDTWNMDPAALEKAFALYPDVRLVVMAHLYGFPAKIQEISKICKKHGALLVEDAAESLGASVRGQQTGSFGDYGAISYNGNKIITGSSGGCLLTNVRADAEKARKWSTQSREDAPWYQHEDVGYNYRMSNIIAGIVRGQYSHLAEHIAQKKAIWQRYQTGLKGLPISMNPFDETNSTPNYWLSCLLIDPAAMCAQHRTANQATYTAAPGKSCPTEILEALSSINAEGRPIWKPMHLQPMYANHAFVTAPGETAGPNVPDVGADIFHRGLCLPSDIKMTAQQQDKIIRVIRACFE